MQNKFLKRDGHFATDDSGVSREEIAAMLQEAGKKAERVWISFVDCNYCGDDCINFELDCNGNPISCSNVARIHALMDAHQYGKRYSCSFGNRHLLTFVPCGCAMDKDILIREFYSSVVGSMADSAEIHF